MDNINFDFKFEAPLGLKDAQVMFRAISKDSIQKTNLINRIHEIANITSNYSHDFYQITPKAIKNSSDIIRQLSINYVSLLNNKCIQGSAWGTILFSWKNIKGNEVTVEVGDHHTSYTFEDDNQIQESEYDSEVAVKKIPTKLESFFECW
ncbi:hypothetical protein [Owenweeksia hongkongensis]|uniref:hypothetical protein n=1 Tax=Owenweeksia hongkongensis TaxID=253245 RepID=UPI003A8E79F6